MTILICYYFCTYRNFKEYYLDCICGCFHKEFPHAVSYNRFVELMPRVFCKMILFMRLYAFGKCTGITFVDSTMIPVCHNVRRYFNKVFSRLAKNGKFCPYCLLLFLTINLRHYLFMSSQGRQNCLHTNLIPNSSNSYKIALFQYKNIKKCVLWMKKHYFCMYL